ncbi:MAG: radical SAM protein [Candidatus Moranbacteria bacterium]|nr:radical SAM protein [Candidatus Moranbacteria bacterium]
MFNFIGKMQFHQNKINSLLEDRIENSLTTVFIDLVSGVCNHKCVFCDGNFNPIKKLIFSKSKLLEIANDLGDMNVDSVIMVGEGGESLLNPNFCFFSKKLLDKKIHLGMYTNGGMLNKKNLGVISRFDFIRISLDSGSSITHQQVHGYEDRDDFNKIFESIEYLRKRSKIQIGSSFLLLPQNVDDLYEAAKRLKEAGANYIEVRPAYLRDYGFDLKAFKSIKDRFLYQLDKMDVLNDDSFKVIINNQLKEIIKNKKTIRGDVTRLKRSRNCLTCRLRLVVSPTGCYICPPNRSKEDFRIGDIWNNPLRSIWNNREHLDKINKKCDLKCPYHKQNNFLIKLKKNNLIFDDKCLLPAGKLITQKNFL